MGKTYIEIVEEWIDFSHSLRQDSFVKTSSEIYDTVHACARSVVTSRVHTEVHRQTSSEPAVNLALMIDFIFEATKREKKHG